MTKQETRLFLKKTLAKLSTERKHIAQDKALNYIKALARKYKAILSFYPLSDEINILPANTFLAKQKKLLLPKVVGQELKIFWVDDIKNQLQKTSLGVYEPVESCKPALHKDLSIAIIPGLGFDVKNNRLGRGLGYYDRFLNQNKYIYSIGIGYLEQLLDVLPKNENDIPMHEVHLF